MKSVLLYFAYALTLVFINCSIAGAPLSVGLLFAMLICGTNIVAVPSIYVLASAVRLDWIYSLCALFEGAFLAAVTYIYRKSGKKIRAEAAAYAGIALAPFIAFSRFSGELLFTYFQNAYLIRAVVAVGVIIFTYFCFRAVYSLLFRLCRCRLRADEIICLAVVFSVAGAGLFNLAGKTAYACVCAGLIAFFIRLFKSPSAVIFAFVCALPCAAVTWDINAVTPFVIVGCLALPFARCGRCAPSAACTTGTAVYLYFSGAFESVTYGILNALLLFCCCLIAALPTERKISGWRELLTVEKKLAALQEESFCDELSDKLFRISEVFREIEGAFLSLDDEIDEGALRHRAFAELKERQCYSCKNIGACAKTSVYKGFSALIDAGAVKGKVSLVDLTADVTKNCASPSSLIENANRILAEYRRLLTEAENAKNGRRLLAEQAKGVAEVLKSRAAELYRNSPDETALEKAAQNGLAENGISCPEIKIFGGENMRITAVTVDAPNSAKVKNCLEKTTGKKLLLKDKVVFDERKTAYIFVQPPPYDAAFGVAFAVKDGERISGDTHSVIRINEHAFLMALSDGMGSGEYAQRISSAAISLIEAFYRAEMPTDVVLDVINKLLCFNRDERFACIDVAAIDLNDLTSSFIKIGSPAGIIVRRGEIKVLESHSLPLGILDNLHPTTCREQLKKDDIAVFMSDGITSAFPTPTELYDFLQTLKPRNPQLLAEEILSAARERTLGVNDDMTVVCVRVYEK